MTTEIVPFESRILKLGPNKEFRVHLNADSEVIRIYLLNKQGKEITLAKRDEASKTLTYLSEISLLTRDGQQCFGEIFVEENNGERKNKLYDHRENPELIFTTPAETIAETLNVLGFPKPKIDLSIGLKIERNIERMGDRACGLF